MNHVQFTSIINDRTAKSSLLESSVCPCSYINFDGFSSAKRFQQQISRLRIVVKKTYNFSQKSELTKVHTFVISLFFFCGFRDGNENFAEIAATSLSLLASSRSIFTLALQREPATGRSLLELFLRCLN